MPHKIIGPDWPDDAEVEAAANAAYTNDYTIHPSYLVEWADASLRTKAFYRERAIIHIRAAIATLPEAEALLERPETVDMIAHYIAEAQRGNPHMGGPMAVKIGTEHKHMALAAIAAIKRASEG